MKLKFRPSGDFKNAVERFPIAKTLRTTSAALKSVRRAVAKSGHLEAMSEIDTLLHVAISETDKLMVTAGIGTDKS